MRYNVDAEYLRDHAVGVSGSITTAAQDRFDKSSEAGITAFARARTELTKELGL